jgi:hypothetical protein
MDKFKEQTNRRFVWGSEFLCSVKWESEIFKENEKRQKLRGMVGDILDSMSYVQD